MKLTAESFAGAVEACGAFHTYAVAMRHPENMRRCEAIACARMDQVLAEVRARTPTADDLDEFAMDYLKELSVSVARSVLEMLES